MRSLNSRGSFLKNTHVTVSAVSSGLGKDSCDRSSSSLRSASERAARSSSVSLVYDFVLGDGSVSAWNSLSQIRMNNSYTLTSLQNQKPPSCCVALPAMLPSETHDVVVFVMCERWRSNVRVRDRGEIRKVAEATPSRGCRRIHFIWRT